LLLLRLIGHDGSCSFCFVSWGSLSRSKFQTTRG
jgi:hypothetical protein